MVQVLIVVSWSYNLKSNSPLGDSNFAKISEVSIAKNNKNIKNDGSQGNSPKAITHILSKKDLK
ncbi:MAG: hypothetical protein P8H40_01920 [Winogradskyella sp.]|jgi:hypothetical protein|nr:hypothetical protein [Winogradskyella sp.]